jgi:hypothetical protein
MSICTVIWAVAGQAVVDDDLHLRLGVVQHVQQRRLVGDGAEVELPGDGQAAALDDVRGAARRSP